VLPSVGTSGYTPENHIGSHLRKDLYSFPALTAPDTGVDLETVYTAAKHRLIQLSRESE
jgi:hypothetical protein